MFRSIRCTQQLTYIFLLTAVTLAAIVLRGWNLGESLWLDELHTSWVVWDRWIDVAPRAAIGNQTPAFFLLCKLWVGVAGASEWTLRSVSLLAGVAVTPVAGVVTQRWTGSRTAGLAAAGVLAVDPTMIYYAQEARPYALVQLVALVNAWLTWRLGRQPSWQWRLRWWCGQALLVHLHLTAALAAASQLMGAWRPSARGGSNGQARETVGALDLVVIGVLLAPLAPLVWTVYQRRETWQSFVPSATLIGLAWLPPWLWFVSVPMLALGLDRLLRWATPLSAGPGPVLDADARRLLACWLLGPIIISWCLSRWGDARLFYPRYLAAVWPALGLVSGCLLSRVRLTWVRRLAAVATVCWLAYVGGVAGRIWDDGRVAPARDEDWRAAVAWLNGHRSPDAALWIRSDYLEADRLPKEPENDLLRRYALSPVLTLYRAEGDPRHWTPLPTTASWSAAADALPRQVGELWCVLHATPRTTSRLADHMRRSGFRLQRRRDFGNVVVLQLLR